MPSVDIRILRVDDPPIWGEWAADHQAQYLDPETTLKVVIIEKGMGSGLPSIAIGVELLDGSGVIVQTSLAAITGIVAAARGAFPEAFRGGPFEVKQ